MVSSSEENPGGCIRLLARMIQYAAEWKEFPLSDILRLFPRRWIVWLFLCVWPRFDTATLTQALHNPQWHPQGLHAILQQVRANTEISPMMLQVACLVYGAPILPPLGIVVHALCDGLFCSSKKGIHIPCLGMFGPLRCWMEQIGRVVWLPSMTNLFGSMVCQAISTLCVDVNASGDQELRVGFAQEHLLRDGNALFLGLCSDADLRETWAVHPSCVLVVFFDDHHAAALLHC